MGKSVQQKSTRTSRCTTGKRRAECTRTLPLPSRLALNPKVIDAGRQTQPVPEFVISSIRRPARGTNAGHTTPIVTHKIREFPPANSLPALLLRIPNTNSACFDGERFHLDCLCERETPSTGVSGLSSPSLFLRMYCRTMRFELGLQQLLIFLTVRAMAGTLRLERHIRAMSAIRLYRDVAQPFCNP